MGRRNPVSYAETDLGVHEVYSQLQEVDANVETFRKQLLDLTISKRELASRIEDREGQISDEQRAANLECSQAAFERLLKDAIRLDPVHKEMRVQYLELSFEVDRAEMELEIGRARQRTLRVRIEELAGLLRFYAAGKEATTVAQLMVNSATSWPY